MSEMIERVAKALYEPWARAFKVVPTWEGADAFSRDEFLQIARTAVSAMREPTEAMCTALITADKHENTGEYNRNLVHAPKWRAMIDEALK